VDCFLRFFNASVNGVLWSWLRSLRSGFLLEAGQSSILMSLGSGWMERVIRTLMVLLLGVAAWAIPGCESKITKDTSPTAGLPIAKDALMDLSELLKRLSEGGQAMPADASAFAGFDVEHPAIATLISNGMVVYNYGTKLNASDASGKWVAMQSEAQQKGGWVLLANGDLKDMPAADVAALQPATP